MAQHNDTGKWGEELAADFLRKNGYQIMERNWRFGHRDLDIIARSPEGNEVVFVEVKTRSGDIITKPEDAVTYARYAASDIAPTPSSSSSTSLTCCASTL